MTALLLTLSALSIWLYQDAERRQLSSPLAWAALLWLLGPLALALYWTQRPLYAGEYRVGGRVWVGMRAFVVAATAWLLMLGAVLLVWLSSLMPLAAIFALLITLGLLLAGLWALIVLGLLVAAWILRRGRTAEVGPTHAALAGQRAPAVADRLLKVIFLAGLLAVFIFTEPASPHWVESVEWQAMPDRFML